MAELVVEVYVELDEVDTKWWLERQRREAGGMTDEHLMFLMYMAIENKDFEVMDEG